MAKKFFPKALSVGLSLALCASMVMPSFAAVALNKDKHIDKDGALLSHEETNDAGDTVTSYDYYLEEDVKLDKTLVIKDGVDASIDLNGYDLKRYDDVTPPDLGSYAGHTGYSSVIEVQGELTVKDTDENGGNNGETGAITGGFALHGGGGVNVNGGTFNLEGGEISGNATYYDGGAGVYVHENGTFNMSGGEISGNSMSTNGVGGGVRVEDSTFNMSGGTITENEAGNGGGVSVKGGTFNMSGDATINDNFGKFAGGGVYLDSAKKDTTFTMDGGTISDNTTDGYGGGVGTFPMNDQSSKDVETENHVTMNGGSITNNHADNDVGGGVSIRYGDFTMNNGEISNNTAKTNGGGVHSYYADTTINGGTIKGNSVNTTDGRGGGVFLFGEDNVSSMTGGTITDNKAAYGGGVDVDTEEGSTKGTTFNVSGGEISKNEAVNGGGVSVIGGATLNVTDGEISGNTATSKGGGVYMYNGANFTMNDGSITGNEANGAKYGGGGVYSFKGTTFTMNGGEISGNTATNAGGGVFNHTATFNMNGGKIYNNGADTSSDDIFSNVKDGGSITLIAAENMGAELNGETVNRWLWDASNARYEDGYYFIPSLTKNAVLRLKAAPSQFFTVTVSNGYNNTPILSQSLERNTAFPKIDDPTRDGYNFIGWSMKLPETVNGNINLVAQWEALPEPPVPDDPTIEIDDPATPLASGPVTRAQFIDYLWRHEGEPASDGVCTFTDVAGDHEFILALAWAEQNGVAEAYLNAEGHVDGTFEPEELVTVAAVKEFLGNFADAFGTNAVAALDLTTLAVDDEEAVLNCDEVLAEFFGEEYTPAKDEDIEIAA